MPDRPLEAYSSEVLADFIRGRGISYFPEELDFIEQRLSIARFVDLFGRPPASSPDPQMDPGSPAASIPNPVQPCPKCHGLGQVRVHTGWIPCDCPMGKDLVRAAAANARRRQPQTASPDRFRQALESWGIE